MPSLLRSHSSLWIGAPSTPAVEVDVKVTVSLLSGALGETVNDADGFVGSSGSAAARCTAVPMHSTRASRSVATRRGVIRARAMRANGER